MNKISKIVSILGTSFSEKLFFAFEKYLLTGFKYYCNMMPACGKSS